MYFYKVLIYFTLESKLTKSYGKLTLFLSFRMLAEKLNMTAEEAERWIVNLIRNARLDAKIDSKFGHVVMGTQAVSQYQQLIEKTKAMAIRTQVLAMNIEKKLSSNQDRGLGWSEF